MKNKYKAIFYGMALALFITFLREQPFSNPIIHGVLQIIGSVLLALVSINAVIRWFDLKEEEPTLYKPAAPLTETGYVYFYTPGAKGDKPIMIDPDGEPVNKEFKKIVIDESI